MLVEQLLTDELDRLRSERRAIERRREELVKRAKQLQAKTQSRRNAGERVYTGIHVIAKSR